MKDTHVSGVFGGDIVPFPELGSGSQFHTFDMNDGRVLKLPLTAEETHIVMARRRHNMQPLSKAQTASVEARVQTALNGKSRIPAMVGHSFYNAKDFLALLGNPTLVNAENVLPKDTPDKQWGSGRVIYMQDKLSMVGRMLESFEALPVLGRGDVLQLRQLIDLYVEQTYLLWNYGFADYVFKIGDTGLDANNNLIFADLGEFSADAAFMRRVLADRRWLHSIVPDKIDFPQIPKPLHKYYTETLDNAFTETHFLAQWGQKHQCSSCNMTNGDAISAFIAAKVAEIDYVDRW
jgi:hypothetical protein